MENYLSKPIIDRHQKDVELILRVFSLSYHLDEYEKPMKEYLNKISKKNKNLSLIAIEKFKEDFIATSKIIVDNLRPKPFNVSGPLNTSIFDSVFCTLLTNINKIPKHINEKYELLLKDEQFINYATLATTDEKILKARFKYVKEKLLN